MKTVISTAFIAVAITFAAPVIASDDHSGHGAMHASTQTMAAMTDGTVKKVDKATGKVTLAHGALTNLGMPPMTMVFRVKDATWLDQMKDGDKVRFIADNVNGSLTVVKLDRVN
ncbi:MAG: copper-binding protein [Sterolibacterium sp.]|jgi:Cu/Ag efflux protein CusF